MPTSKKPEAPYNRYYAMFQTRGCIPHESHKYSVYPNDIHFDLRGGLDYRKLHCFTSSTQQLSWIHNRSSISTLKVLAIQFTELI